MKLFFNRIRNVLAQKPMLMIDIDISTRITTQITCYVIDAPFFPSQPNKPTHNQRAVSLTVAFSLGSLNEMTLNETDVMDLWILSGKKYILSIAPSLCKFWTDVDRICLFVCLWAIKNEYLKNHPPKYSGFHYPQSLLSTYCRQRYFFVSEFVKFWYVLWWYGIPIQALLATQQCKQ